MMHEQYPAGGAAAAEEAQLEEVVLHQDEFRADVAAQVCDPAEIGIVPQEGTRANVCARLTVENFPMAVVHVVDAQGNEHTLLSGLSVGDQGQLQLRPEGLTEIRPDAPVTIGRQTDAGGTVGIERFIGAGNDTDYVSRRHFTLSMTGADVLNITDHSTNGTGLVARRILASPALEDGSVTPAPAERISHSEEARTALNLTPEELAQTQEMARRPINFDPTYRKLAEEFRGRIARLESQQRTTMDPDVRRTLGVQITQEREAMEQAIKPILRARLEVMRGDRTAGYLCPGAVAVDERAGTVTSRTSVSGRMMVSGRDRWLPDGAPWGDSFSGLPRLGQVVVPGRFTDWAGSGSKKTSHKTGKQVTSFDHIVDLAAARLAGTFGDQHEPIEVVRCDARDVTKAFEFAGPHAEGLSDKIPLYKIVGGMHRVAAQRLIDGVDEPIAADKIVRK